MKEISTYIAISKAKSDLLEIIRRLENVEDAVAVTKNGVPAAVIISIERYRGLLGTLDILNDEKTQVAMTPASLLTDAFVFELKNRCAFMGDDKKRALVLELLAQDVQTGLDAAVAEKRQQQMRFVEAMWDKYRSPLVSLRGEREATEQQLKIMIEGLGYA